MKFLKGIGRALWSAVRKSWKAVIPLLVATAWTIAAQFVGGIADNYDGGQTWIVAALTSVSVWLKANKPA